eukprot:1609900-Pleurochrysis_carterae.AAC.1
MTWHAAVMGTSADCHALRLRNGAGFENGAGELAEEAFWFALLWPEAPETPVEHDALLAFLPCCAKGDVDKAATAAALIPTVAATITAMRC